MKRWEELAVAALLFITIGAILVVWGFQAVERINIEQIGNQIKATLNPTFIVLFIIGFFSLGMGFATTIQIPMVYKLEKKLSPPP